MLAGCYSESTDVPLHLSTKATCAETGLLSERAADKRTTRDEGLRLGGTLAKPGLQIGWQHTDFLLCAFGQSPSHPHPAQDPCEDNSLPALAPGSCVHALLFLLAHPSFSFLTIPFSQ